MTAPAERNARGLFDDVAVSAVCGGAMRAHPDASGVLAYRCRTGWTWRGCGECTADAATVDRSGWRELVSACGWRPLELAEALADADTAKRVIVWRTISRATVHLGGLATGIPEQSGDQPAGARSPDRPVDSHSRSDSPDSAAPAPATQALAAPALPSPDVAAPAPAPPPDRAASPPAALPDAAPSGSASSDSAPSRMPGGDDQDASATPHAPGDDGPDAALFAPAPGSSTAPRVRVTLRGRVRRAVESGAVPGWVRRLDRRLDLDITTRHLTEHFADRLRDAGDDVAVVAAAVDTITTYLRTGTLPQDCTERTSPRGTGGTAVGDGEAPRGPVGQNIVGGQRAPVSRFVEADRHGSTHGRENAADRRQGRSMPVGGAEPRPGTPEPRHGFATHPNPPGTAMPTNGRGNAPGHGVLSRFQLLRHDDRSGVSGTGVVAMGVVFPDGAACLRWLSRPGHESTVSYSHWTSIEEIHGHAGASTLRWLDTPPVEATTAGKGAR